MQNRVLKRLKAASCRLIEAYRLGVQLYKSIDLKLDLRQPLTLILLLSNSFTERQTRSMEDYVETSVMVQYNNR